MNLKFNSQLLSGFVCNILSILSLLYPMEGIAILKKLQLCNAKEFLLIIIAQRNVLFLEMKTEKGRQSEEQKEFQNKVSKLGFEYVICRSFDQSVLAIERWIKIITIK